MTRAPETVVTPPEGRAAQEVVTYGIEDLERLTGLSWQTLKKNKTVPPPLPIGRRRLRWLRSTVDAWLAGLAG